MRRAADLQRCIGGRPNITTKTEVKFVDVIIFIFDHFWPSWTIFGRGDV